MKAIVDTNVLLSAALRDRLPERVVIFVATDDDWKWLVTPEILSEYTGVLSRPKFKLDKPTIEKWAEVISVGTVDIGSPPTTPEFPRDPKDSPFLAAALFGRADFLISGDKDMLEAKGLIAARIVTIAEFAAEFLPAAGSRES